MIFNLRTTTAPQQQRPPLAAFRPRLCPANSSAIVFALLVVTSVLLPVTAQRLRAGGAAAGPPTLFTDLNKINGDNTGGSIVPNFPGSAKSGSKGNLSDVVSRASAAARLVFCIVCHLI
jgi:hypothetical protein